MPGIIYVTWVLRDRIFCGTWNVNGQMPTEMLHRWLSPEEDDPPDIYAIGSVYVLLSEVNFVDNWVSLYNWLGDALVCCGMNTGSGYISYSVVSNNRRQRGSCGTINITCYAKCHSWYTLCQNSHAHLYHLQQLALLLSAWCTLGWGIVLYALVDR